MHVHRSWFVAVARGEMSAERREELLLQHLAALCPVCSREILEGQARVRQPGATWDLETRDPVKRLGERLGLREMELHKRVTTGRGWLRELLKAAPGERRGKARRAHVKFKGPVFYVLALEEARRRIPGEPEEALSLADAVLASLRREAGDYPPDPEIHAPALAVRGNALRALGRIRAAEADLLEAGELLESPAFGDPVVAAEVHSYLGSLRKDQGHLEEARHHLDLAATSYGLLPDRAKAARVLLKLSLVHYLAHDPQAAVAATEEALALLDEGSEAWLRAYARYNRAHHLHAAGETERAEEELDTHREFLQDAGDEVTQHVVWLQARIAWSRSDLRAARRLFTQARKAARDRGIPWDAALVGLELALVELAEGRTERARKLATEGLKIFAEQQVERESRAALELLEAAVRRDAVTREVLERAVAALEEGRHRRRLTGRKPS